ncbi:MAG: PDZ domain-containing protein [Candidatus Eisenbacteria bacterium]|uniref:PDZ domain-containing protein n=1 Tax=Eiseniibacteriota bacterium TaxID=2212470 RepID=A0A538TVJ7_UNCEI|nr:MAG: PDZ domain-containing protein [Candidatus Eisenbacteria bacterium]
MRKLVMVRSWWPALLALSLALGAAVAHGQDRGRAWLGVYMQSLTSELREGMDYRGEGVLVSRVVLGSPADEAGIRKGDIVVSLNSRNVTSPEELSRAIHESRVGQVVRVTVVRDGSRRSLSAKLAERSTEDGDSEIAPEAPAPPEAPEPPDMPEGPRAYSFDHDGSATRMALGMGRGRLGVRIEDLNQDLGSYFSVPDGKGVLVIEVLDETPASRAGLKAGDVIVQVGARSVGDTGDLSREIRGAPEGKIPITVVRRGAKRTLDVELGRAPRALWRDFNLGPMGLRDGEGDRTAIRRRAGNADRDELRQLRDEVRMLRERLDKLEQHD